MESPKLDAPGKGLPFPDKYILRIVAPIISKRSNWDDSAKRYMRISQKIITLLDGMGAKLNEETLNRRILVDPIKGLEDSSRFWSLGMTLDHLMITGEGFKKTIIELSNGRVPAIEVRVENVKPPAVQHSLETVQRFKATVASQISEIDAALGDRSSRAKLKHPWFGPFTAHQWMWIMSVHQGIHFQQMKGIVGKF